MADHAGTRQGTLHVPNSREAIERAQREVLSAMDAAGYPPASGFAIRLALEEALANAFRHGHKDLPATETVEVRYRVGPRHVDLSVQDRGPGFDPQQVPDPTLEENLERPSGRGIMLMRSFMSVVRFGDRGRLVEMLYHHPGEGE